MTAIPTSRLASVEVARPTLLVSSSLIGREIYSLSLFIFSSKTLAGCHIMYSFTIYLIIINQLNYYLHYLLSVIQMFISFSNFQFQEPWHGITIGLCELVGRGWGQFSYQTCRQFAIIKCPNICLYSRVENLCVLLSLHVCVVSSLADSEGEVE